MAAPAGRRVRTRLDAIPHARTALGLGVLLAVSLYLRTKAIDAKFWIDEGLSVGIAHHGFFHIPSLLRQDGSPPMYYMVLNLWMSIVGGDGESRTHALSLLCSVAAIPAAWLLARRIFGVRSAWASAAMVAMLPFLTYYAQETRMYALLAFLSVVAAGTFALAYAIRDRWAAPAFAVALALTLYTHNWGLFLGTGFFAGFLVLVRQAPGGERRALLRDGAIGFGGAALLYLPWVPTLLGQVSDTGAPWAERPKADAIITAAPSLAGGTETALLVAVISVAGLLTLRGGREGSPRARAALALGVALGVGIVLAWLTGMISRGWTIRYLTAFVGPALLLTGAGMVRYGKVGLVALAIALVLWFDPHERQIRGKSNVYRVASLLKEQSLVLPNDLIVTTHPEQGPLLRYYFGPGYRYADALGPVRDTQVFDWRNATDRLRHSGPRRVLNELAPMVAPGQHLVLMVPLIRSASWGAPWTSTVRRKSIKWQRVMKLDRRFQFVARVPMFTAGLPRGMRAIVYLRH